MNRMICPCCGYFTVESDDEIIVDICDVCFWQYDVVAHNYPDRSIGANHVSLNQARANYLRLGVCKEGFENMVRQPLLIELPENNIN